MKPLKRILILTVCTAFILTFWLAPGINSGTERKYVRYYEDTDALAGNKPLEKFKLASNYADTTHKKRVYKKEVIEPGKKRKVNGKMFSRAMQFEPLVETNELMLVENIDSIVQVAQRNDTLVVIQ